MPAFQFSAESSELIDAENIATIISPISPAGSRFSAATANAASLGLAMSVAST